MKTTATIYRIGNRFQDQYSKNHYLNQNGATKWKINYNIDDRGFPKQIGKPILLESNIELDSKIKEKIEESKEKEYFISNTPR